MFAEKLIRYNTGKLTEKAIQTSAILRELFTGLTGAVSNTIPVKTVRKKTETPAAKNRELREPFDTGPYALALSDNLLRRSSGKKSERRFRIAFCTDENYEVPVCFNDLVIIPRTRIVNNRDLRGFKIVFGIGPSTQPGRATTALEFLPEDQLLSFTEAFLQVFALYSNYAKPYNSRLKFLVDQYGIEKLISMVDTQRRRQNEEDSLSADEGILPVMVSIFSNVSDSSFPVKFDLLKYQ